LGWRSGRRSCHAYPKHRHNCSFEFEAAAASDGQLAAGEIITQTLTCLNNLIGETSISVTLCTSLNMSLNCINTSTQVLQHKATQVSLIAAHDSFQITRHDSPNPAPPSVTTSIISDVRLYTGITSPAPVSMAVPHRDSTDPTAQIGVLLVESICVDSNAQWWTRGVIQPRF
jgi:hypothetical protein